MEVTRKDEHLSWRRRMIWGDLISAWWGQWQLKHHISSLLKGISGTRAQVTKFEKMELIHHYFLVEMLRRDWEEILHSIKKIHVWHWYPDGRFHQVYCQIYYCVFRLLIILLLGDNQDHYQVPFSFWWIAYVFLVTTIQLEPTCYKTKQFCQKLSIEFPFLFGLIQSTFSSIRSGV